LPVGFQQVASKPGGVAQDFVRGGVVKMDKFAVVPGNIPGADNDLRDKLETAPLAHHRDRPQAPDGPHPVP